MTTFTIPFSLVFHIESIPLILHKYKCRSVFPTSTMPHSLIHILSYLMSRPYQPIISNSMNHPIQTTCSPHIKTHES